MTQPVDFAMVAIVRSLETPVVPEQSVAGVVVVVQGDEAAAIDQAAEELKRRRAEA